MTTGSVAVTAPMPGRVLTVADVPDPVFAGNMVGSGAAIDPPRDRGPVDAVAPVDGRLLKLHPHAFVLLTDAGVGILVHIGIDTVKLEGRGFTLLAAEGDQVEAGRPVVRFDPAVIDDSGYSAVSPVVVMDAKPETITTDATADVVDAGDPLFTWVRG